MRHETAQVFVHEGVDAGGIARMLQTRAQALPGVRRVAAGRNLEGCWGAGDCTLDLLVDGDAPDCGPAVADLCRLDGIARIDHVTCTGIDGGLREPGLRDGVWRTLMLRVRPEASAAQVAALERELLQMPAHIHGIRNWRLSRVTSPSAWTHVWQQEFAHVGDLLGEYLMHPFHWGWVDRRFDAECPDWTVDAISHAFCPLASSLLAGLTDVADGIDAAAAIAVAR